MHAGCEGAYMVPMWCEVRPGSAGAGWSPETAAEFRPRRCQFENNPVNQELL